MQEKKELFTLVIHINVSLVLSLKLLAIFFFFFAPSPWVSGFTSPNTPCLVQSRFLLVDWSPLTHQAEKQFSSVPR